MKKESRNKNVRHKYRNESCKDELTKLQLDNFKKRGLARSKSTSFEENTSASKKTSIQKVQEGRPFTSTFADQLRAYLSSNNVEIEEDQA